MRGRRGALGVCLTNVRQSQGGDLDRLSCGLKKRSQKRSPSPSDVPFWTDQPAADADGKSQAMVAASLEVTHDQSKANLTLHSGYKVLQYLKRSTGREAAPAAPVSKAVALSSAPSEEHRAGVSFGIVEALGSDWPGRGPRATDSRAQYPKGESWVSGWPGHPKLREVGFLKGEPLSAIAEGLGTRLELPYPHSELCQLPCACAQVEALPEEETKCVSLGQLRPVFSEQTVGSESALARVSDDLQIVAVGSLAVQSSRGASLSCHS